MNAYVWFGLLLTLMYAVVLPLLVITAGIWAAEAAATRSSSVERRVGRSAGRANDD